MTPTDQTTAAEALVQLGFAPNIFLLTINRSLQVPADMDLPAPWNLPSRMFDFPITVKDAGDGLVRLGLRHAGLADHPFVQRVETALGFKLLPNYGPSRTTVEMWWHAADLVSAGHWRELLETASFTTPEYIADAVSFGLGYEQRCTTADARQILKALGGTEPTDKVSLLLAFHEPSACRQESGRESWPINRGPDTAINRAWAFILAIECGWFAYDRSGFLNWSEAGRDRYAAGDASAFIETSGQSAFAF